MIAGDDDVDRTQCIELIRLCIDACQLEAAITFLIEGVTPKAARQLLAGPAPAPPHDELEAAAAARYAR